MNIELKGILAIEYNPTGKQRHGDAYIVRMRAIFYAEPTTEDLYKYPKSRPDYESAGACWVSAADLLNSDDLRLRGNEPRQWAQ